MNRIFLLFVCLTISVVSFGQDKAASRDAAPEIPPGPSMKETAAWIERNFPLLGAYSAVQVKNDDRSKHFTLKRQIESAVLSDCRLSIRRTEFWEPPISYTETVPLKDVDASKIQAVEAPVPTGYTQSSPIYFVSLIATADRGEPFTYQQKQGDLPAREIKPTRIVRVWVGDKEGANRVADALRRAAVLCGAPSQPVATAVAEPTEKTEVSPTNSASPASPKMTNADVIQLVTAGLSEQVITTSIRQAPTKDFDLTPTGLIALKKAGVSDAVIVVMQERATPAQAASASEVKTPQKYDATLADPPKPAAAPALPTGCEGIELMGVSYIEAGIGATLNIYVGTIRNTGTYTKEVDIEYVKNGVTTKGTWNVGAGQKIEARLDVNNRAPTNVRITGCR